MKNNKKRIFKTKIKATDKSQLTGQPMNEVMQDKFDYLIDRVEIEPPHILWVSKYAFMWGHGKLFNALDKDNPISKPFLTTFKENGHLPIKRPTNTDLRAMEYKYGITLSFPHESLWSLIQNGFRKLEKKINKRDGMTMMPCHGYINKNGKLIQPNGFADYFADNSISGYFIFRIDGVGIQKVQEQLIDESDIILQLQFERAKYTQDKIMEKRLKTAASIEKSAISRYDKLKPYIAELRTNHPINDWNILFDKDASEELNQ